MLHDMRHSRSLNSLCLWVLSHNLHNLWVFHCSHVNTQVGFMVLQEERFNRFAIHQIHVFRNGVNRLHVRLVGNNLLCVLHAQRLNHLPVKIGQVIYLWSASRQLKHSLELNNTLTHR